MPVQRLVDGQVVLARGQVVHVLAGVRRRVALPSRRLGGPGGGGGRHLSLGGAAAAAAVAGTQLGNFFLPMNTNTKAIIMN